MITASELARLLHDEADRLFEGMGVVTVSFQVEESLDGRFVNTMMRSPDDSIIAAWSVADAGWRGDSLLEYVRFSLSTQQSYLSGKQPTPAAIED